MKLFLLSFALLVGCMAPGLAEETSTRASAAPEKVNAALAEATFSYLNRPVITFRGAVLDVPPQDRARSAVQRLDNQVERGGPLVVSVKPSVIGQMVQVDNATVFFVTKSDLDPLSTDTLETATAQAVTRFEKVIAEVRESRDGPALWRGALGAAIATVVAVALARLVIWLRQIIQRRMLRWSAMQISRLRIGNVTLLRRERVVSVIRFMLTAVTYLLYAVLLYEWLSVVLAQFPFTRPWGELLNDFLLDLIRTLVLGIAGAIPGLVTAAVIFLLARAVARAVDAFFLRVQEGQVKVDWLDADLAFPTRRIAALVIWLFAVAMAYPYLPGSQTEAFKGMSVLIGLMVSMGASSLVGQAFSGLILTYGRVYRRGEFVRIGEFEGTVTNVGTFTTRIRTGMGEELTLSNSSILGSTTANFSRAVVGEGKHKGFVVDAKVTIGYDTPWRQVHAMLILAAHRTPGVMAEPKAQVYQTALSDWYPEYRLVCHASPGAAESRANVISALHANIQDTFNEFGVQIMSPQYFEDPAQPKIVPPENWYAAPATPPAPEKQSS